jgi:hypothetical protein
MSCRSFLCALLVALVGCGSETPPNTTAPTPAPQQNRYTLSGTVRGDADALVEGADVTVNRDPRRLGFGQAKTDAQGHYLVSDLFPGSQPVSVSKPGYLRIEEAIEITDGTVKDFTLRPGVVVSGRTVEAGVGPLNGVTITVTSGPNTGLQSTSAPPLGGFSLRPMLPGDFTIRASKAGYDSVDRAVHAMADTHLEISLKWAYGSCLTSVAPLLFERVPAAGARENVAVQAQGRRSWTATPNVSWVKVSANARANGSAILQFDVQAHQIGALDVRSGAIEIRCSETEGQNIWITQGADCQATVEPDGSTPRVFPREGGVGRLLVRFGVPGCRARDYSDVDWISLPGAGSYMTGVVNLLVQSNQTGVPRTGTIVVGEIRWTVRQDQ